MVGIISDRTKRIDKTAKKLAQDFKRSDIKSARRGEAQPSESRGEGVIWADPKTLGSMNIMPSISGQPVGINPHNVGNLSGPRVGSFFADHQNLKIKR